jgi:hypothetical protein
LYVIWGVVIWLKKKDLKRGPFYRNIFSYFLAEGVLSVSR